MTIGNRLCGLVPLESVMVRTALRASFALVVFAAATVWLHAASHVVSQKGKVFAPGTITVAVGDTVTFKNDDDVTHNAFSTSKGNEFNAKAQTPGSAADIAFKVKGTVAVKCAFHPGMSLTVKVE